MASNCQHSSPHKASPITTDLGFFVRKDKAEEELPKMAHPSSLNWKSAIDELTKGHDLVSELEAILPAGTDTDLVREISGSFSRALVALKSEEKSKDFDGKKRKFESGQKGRQRKRTQSGSCTRTTAILNDGHLWRKYGQKTILNFKFPRGYFRCTNKYDQNCPATKQVQQSEEDPSLYVITYIGEHTCQRSTAASLMTCHEKKEACCIINFGTGNHSEELKFPPPLLATRQEYSCEEGISSTLSNHASCSSKFFPIMPELEALEAGSNHLIMGGGPEHSDVTSCLQPSEEDDDDLAWDYDFSGLFSTFN